MIKPKRLQAGATIAALSLSSGMAGDPDILWRYEQGKQQLVSMGFRVVETEMTLAGTEYVYKHPKERAESLHKTLLDPKIDGIIATIGGIESYRIFQYIDLEIIRQHPKVFIGYSDSTSIHQMFRLAGVVSFYGPCLLVDFAENGGVFDFTKEVFQNVLMKDSTNYVLPWRKEWTSQFLPWEFENKHKTRSLVPDEGVQILQGSGVAQGRLLGGCLEVFSMLRGTELYPTKEMFRNGI